MSLSGGMVDRLVLGSGPLVSSVAGSLQEQSGTVQVVTADEKRAESLRETGVSVFALDPTDPATLERSGDGTHERPAAQNQPVDHTATGGHGS